MVFFDSTHGNVATFFHYKARLKDFHKEIMKVQAQSRTKEEAVNVIREGIMWAAKVGTPIAINFEGYNIDLKDEWNLPDALFDTNLIFDSKTFRENENYKKILKPEEDVDDQGNKGYYLMKKDY